MPRAARFQKVIGTIRDAARTFGILDAFFVGGYPRAMAMGLGLRDVHDLDVATGAPDKAIQLAGLVAEAGDATSYEIKHRTNAVTLEVDGVEIDFQGASAHEHVLPYLHAWGLEPTPVAMNVFDRDFTMNSLTIPLHSNQIIDLTGRGLVDIEEKRVATILPPNDIVPRNPLTITRAVRFSHKYGFSIDGTLWKAMKDFAHVLPTELTHKRLVIEAHTLAQYDATGTLEELGLEYLANLAKEYVDDE